MDEKIKQALQAMAGQPPHKADYSRRQFIANAARYGLTMTAAAALTAPFAFPFAALAADVELSKIASIPDKLKGSGTVRICSYGGALQDAQRKAYFKPFEELSGIKVIEAEGPDPAKVKAMVDSKNIEYDVTELDGADVLNLQKGGEYFEPIDYSLFDVDNIDPTFRQKLYVNMLPYAQIFASRTATSPAPDPCSRAPADRTPTSNSRRWRQACQPTRSIQSISTRPLQASPRSSPMSVNGGTPAPYPRSS
jgi:putative spermidine/putrescine transport system substrate-binding protein